MKPSLLFATNRADHLVFSVSLGVLPRQGIVVRAGDQKVKFECKGLGEGERWILLKGNKVTDGWSESGGSALAPGWKAGTLFVTCAFSFLL